MTYTQKVELEKIIASFTEEDNEAVCAEVEYLDESFRTHHFTQMIKANLPHFDNEIFALATGSMEFQELASKAIWDSLVILVKHQRAREIYSRYDEVA